MTDYTFAGQVALVTGSSGGLGFAHALELGRRGAHVAVNDVAVAADGRCTRRRRRSSR